MNYPPTVFLDRDGVINRNRPDYIKSWSEFQFLPGACEALARLTQAGYRIFVVTNQACVGRGIAALEAIEEIHERMRAEVGAAGGRIEAALWCPHRPDEGCVCRKPAPGLLIQARERYGADLSRATLVGDSACDIQAACAVGVAPILLTADHTPESVLRVMESLPSGAMPCRTAHDLAHAADLILSERMAPV